MVSKDDLVEKFVAVTGTDKNTASHLLEACSNNLENAVTTFLDGGLQENETNGNTTHVSSVRAPIPQTQGVLVDDLQPTTRWSSRRGRSVFDGFNSLTNDEDKKKAGQDKKLQKLEELFRPPIDMMHQGTFQSAREAAVKSNKWLMVNIQNVTEFSCQTLNRDVWSSPNVKHLVNEHFLFWQESSESIEGDWFMTFYTVDQWPHISIIDPRTGGRLHTIKDSTKDKIIENINAFLADHGLRLDSDPASSKSSKEDILRLNEDEQLAAAIEASLKESSVNSSRSNDSVTDFDRLFPEEGGSSVDRLPVIKSRESSVDRLPDAESQGSSVDRLPVFKASSEEAVSSNANTCTPPTKRTFQKVFLTRKRKLSQPAEQSSPTKVNRLDEESCKYFLPPQYPANGSCSTGNEAEPSSPIRLLLKHPDGKREEITLNTSSKVEDLTSAVSSKYDLTTHELVKNFPRVSISSLPGKLLLDRAGVFDKDTVFIQEKL